jgi:hypothetical protein
MDEQTVLKENEDYQLVPNDNNSWNVRILEGEFVETVFKFNTIKVVDEGLSFDFTIVSTPDPDLSIENEGLQEYVGSILLSVITESLKEQE